MSATPSRPKKSYGKWFLITTLAFTLSLLVAVWLLGGKITLYFLGDYLKEHHQVQLSPQSELTLNPFLSRITGRNLELVKEEKTVFFLSQLQLSWVLVDLFSKKVLLDEAHLDGMFLHTDLTQNRIAGITLPPADNAPQPEPEPDTGPLAWQVHLPRFTYSNAQFELHHQLANGAPRTELIALDLFELKDLSFSEQQTSLQALLQARINEAPLKVSTQATIAHPLNPDRLDVKSMSRYQLSGFNTQAYAAWLPETLKQLMGTLAIKGDLGLTYHTGEIVITQKAQEFSAHQLQAQWEDMAAETSKIEIRLADLTLKITPATSPESTAPVIRLQTGSEIQANNLRFTGPEDEQNNRISASVQQLRFKTSDIEMSQNNNAMDLTANETQLETQGLALNLHPIFLENASESIHLHALQLKQTNDKLRVQATPALTMGSTQVYLLHDKNLAASWESLALEPGEIVLQDNQPEIALPALTIDQLVVSQPYRDDLPKPLLQTEQLQVSGIQLFQNHLMLRDIGFDRLDTEAILTADRQLHNLLDLPQTANSQKPSVPQNPAVPQEPAEPREPSSGQGENGGDQQATPESPFTVAIGQLRLSEGSQLRFTDQLSQPPITQQLVIKQFSVGPLDTGKSDEITQVVLDATSGEYGKISVAGNLKPLTPKTNLNLKGKIQEISLPPSSFYIRDALGYDIESGQLNSEFDVAIVENKLNGDASVLLQAFVLTSPEADQKAVSTGAISLNAAVGLLTDSDGNIDLAIPMSGDLDSPTFGVGTFLTIVLKKAVMVAAQEVMLQSLVPYAGVASLALEAGSELMKVKFAPLPYEPTQIAPSDAQQDYLAKFAEVMKQNKDIQVRMCAKVTPADLGITPLPESLNDAQKQSLLDLGLTREKQLKAALVNMGLESARLLECKPQIVSSTNTPEIDLDT